MSKLTKGERKALPTKDFAGPGRSFPVENKKHARAAELDAGVDAKKGKISEGEKKKIDAKADKVLKKK